MPVLQRCSRSWGEDSYALKQQARGGAQHDVADLERALAHRLDRHQRAVVDLALHAVAARPKAHRLARQQSLDVTRRPAHVSSM